jgi:hypothetical protein
VIRTVVYQTANGTAEYRTRDTEHGTRDTELAIGDSPVTLRALPAQKNCTGAICSTCSQRAVASSCERRRVWRLRFSVVLHRFASIKFFGLTGAKGILGQSPLPKYSNRQHVSASRRYRSRLRRLYCVSMHFPSPIFFRVHSQLVRRSCVDSGVMWYGKRRRMHSWFHWYSSASIRG